MNLPPRYKKINSLLQPRAMNNDSLYLRPNIQVEPLFDSWYAWSHLIPPMTAARNLTERHLKIMDSYIATPQAHANAVKNPKLLGGPFVDYGGKRVDEIRTLRDQTKRSRQPLLELSAAIASLDEILRTHAKGFSLQPLYNLVPESLKGYVELVYDLNHNPSFRVIEPLLYRSHYFDRSAQSLMLSALAGDDRSFVLSTPRLESDSHLHLHLPFDDEVVDELFRLKTAPRPWGYIKELLNAPEASERLLASFLAPDPPPPYSPYRGGGVRWRYFGHACVLLETSDMSILFDPVLSYTYESDVSRYTYQDLPDSIDYVVITHNHQDHVSFETLLQIKHKVKTFIVPSSSGGALQDPSLKLILKRIGCGNVVELNEMESVEWENGSITLLPFLGEHADLNIRCKAAHLVRIGERALLFAADSRNVEPRLYERLRDMVGDLDAIFLGMECEGAPLSWLYGPLFTKKIERALDESRRLAGSNFEQAIDLVLRFGCKSVFVYAMGQEPWLRYIMSIKYTDQSRQIIESNRLIQECREHGIYAERLFGKKEAFIEDVG
jgi:L-ascorbate metabolism protein UlaG (beta-lactamase superfamily)